MRKAAISIRENPRSSVAENALATRWLGRLSFAAALALQEDVVARKREDHSLGDELLLLEHEPVYTIGRTPDRSSLRDANQLPHPLVAINRGGQATYHGPGQLVGYPIIDLRKRGQDLHVYLRWMEGLLIAALAQFQVVGWTRPGLTGVWVADRKVASIGVGVRQWITMHGFALNVGGDLSAFSHIVPCGIANVSMTSIEKETGVRVSVVDVARVVEAIAERHLSALRPVPLSQETTV